MVKIMARYQDNYEYEVERQLKTKSDALESLESDLLLGVLQMMTPGTVYSITKGIDKVTVVTTYTNGETSRTEYRIEEY